MPGMLYYPDINPSNAGLYHALLYWDRIATVVPPNYAVLLDDRMREVADAGLYEPIEAGLIYDPARMIDMDVELVAALEQIPLDDLLPPLDRVAYPGSGFYAAKADSNCLDLLQGMGLVLPDRRGPEVWVMNPRVQLVMLSIIARRVAAEQNAIVGHTASSALRPFTDKEPAYWLGHRPLSGMTSHAGHVAHLSRTEACWRVEIGRLLPVPAEDVLLSDVLRFRERYKPERERLLMAVEKLLHDLAQRWEHPEDIVREAEQQLTEALDNLRSAARATRRRWLTRSVAVCVAIISSGTAAGLGASLGADVDAEAISQIALATTVAGAAVNIATTPIRGSDAPTSPYTYLQRVRSELRLD
ncbi:DUF6236 family protein [Micromonospora sp. RHAY321]|uniref:DUF6236 family protein n=1 Tax=Micromonospora sp. RHAY321 TaxID=2944807 RepID=UPI00207CE629|nr:DUF6236 family protein [Micromonospora sp. RHAY321]MCO1597620.1 DUF6236 family protein [Micromonospora sp. RHAY321]